MSTHPNVILKLTVKAPGTTRDLLRSLLKSNRESIPDEVLPPSLYYNSKPILNVSGTPVKVSRMKDEICIGFHVYRMLVMEDSYDDDWQISGEEGDLIIFRLVTYGYGEEISWGDLSQCVGDLKEWADSHHLESAVSISANYW